jgi:putative zinc finger/helix-turn-helix YgiT family protein
MEEEKMNNKCGVCETKMKNKRETVPYECGLDGIVLEDITVSLCPKCGEREVEVPNTLKLHHEIAMALARKAERLGPKEIRFLRKYLGLSSTEFANKVGVDKASVSRWERIEEPTAMGGQTERLLRVLVMSEKPVESYALDEVAVKKPKTMKMRFAPDRSGWRAHAA